MVIGFSYIFNVAKVFHLAHAGIFVLGGFSFWKSITLDFNWFFAATIAIIISSLLILLIEKAVYYPMTKRKTDPSVTLIASMGIYVVLVNLLAMFFGSNNKIISTSVETFETSGILITSTQIIQLLVAFLTIVILQILFKFTKLELTFRAIANNDLLGEIFGINYKKIRNTVMIIGSILAVIASILLFIEIGIEPHSGMNITLTAAVVTILVNRIEIKYLVIFSIVLSLFQNSVEWFLNAQWKEGLTYTILLLVILFKTEGLVSYKLRKN